MSVDFSWGCWPSVFSTFSWSSLFCRNTKILAQVHQHGRNLYSTVYLFVLSQAFDPKALSCVKEARETVLVYADLPVVNEFHDAREFLILDVLQYDDWVLPGGEIAQDLNKTIIIMPPDHWPGDINTSLK